MANDNPKPGSVPDAFTGETRLPDPPEKPKCQPKPRLHQGVIKDKRQLRINEIKGGDARKASKVDRASHLPNPYRYRG